MREPRLKILASGDRNSAFNSLSASEIIEEYGLPAYLLGTSAKVEKCQAYGVLARILYLTPGVFCPFATGACLEVCNGHSSGRMRMPQQVRARDKRTALYVEEREYFIARLKSELHLLQADALRLEMQPAARLNGSSDIAWEQQHPELFELFPDIQFYDYTKSTNRTERFLDPQSRWPKNYHLTFSAAADTRNIRVTSRRILARGGTVTVPFTSHFPKIWWGYPVIDGDLHDARFLDSDRHIVALRAKGLARNSSTRFCFEATTKVGEIRRTRGV